jgi:hypothetical protein
MWWELLNRFQTHFFKFHYHFNLYKWYQVNTRGQLRELFVKWTILSIQILHESNKQNYFIDFFKWEITLAVRVYDRKKQNQWFSGKTYLFSL